MDAVLRAIAIYAILLIVFRIAGKRALSQITTFDFVLILVIGEATQQALLGSDFSITNAALVIVTLLGLDIGLSLLVSKVPALQQVVEDVPLVIVEDGRMLKERLAKSRVDVTDIMEEARRLQGLERMEQIKYAVLERNGGISIIPKG
ncbi:MAG TPA: YetF domain-containing protein [Candidatus Limnocylindria bacterium]|nr:YetF domain-containing protein [Candidatus Limnocylindria bacterium]